MKTTVGPRRRCAALIGVICALAAAGCSTPTPETITVTSVVSVAPDPPAISAASTSTASTTAPTQISAPASAASTAPSAPSIALSSAPASSLAHATTGELHWPLTGAAAIQLDDGRIQTHNDTTPRAIASVAKMMTAYLILLRMPLADGAAGPGYTVTAADVADSDERYRLDQSGVPVKTGEVISERDMLEALLLPSANNIAAMLATWQAGDEVTFVAEMNAQAATLGMTRTHYTDPSGFLDSTTSTARDQLVLVDAAMKLPTFAALVRLKTAQIPVAGAIYNTNPVLGTYGFIGVKTGSDDAAGGCLAFRAVRTVGGHQVTVTGVVLGQPGPGLIAAGAEAARQLVVGIGTG